MGETLFMKTHAFCLKVSLLAVCVLSQQSRSGFYIEKCNLL